MQAIDQFASAVEQAALEAAAGAVVRGSVSGWSKLVQRVKRDPKSLRGDARWKDVNFTARRAQISLDYLRSPECQGLLQILMYVEIYDSGDDLVAQRSELEKTFLRELEHKLGDDHDPDSQASGRQLWRVAANAVLLYAVKIKNSADFNLEATFLAQALLSKRVSIPEKRRKNDDTGEPRKAPTIAAAVSERAAFSHEYSRSQKAINLVDEMRQSAAEFYSRLVMPHAREQYSVDIDSIYVPRKLQLVTEGELSKVQVSILLPEIGQSAITRGIPGNTEKVEVNEKEVSDHRIVIIGNPGAGKSTFVRHVLYASNKSLKTAKASFMFELKKYPFDDPQPFYELIARTIRAVNHIETNGSVIRDVFTLGLAHVIFDGLDEVTDLGLRRQLIQTIEEFARRFPLVTITVTSREEGYTSAKLSNSLFAVYRLPDFTQDQVEDYARRWFTLTADPLDENANSLIASFLEESEHAADLRVNPLMLSLLCMIYRYEGYIPENRPQVYEECAELLFDRWDKVRHVRSHIRSDAKGRYLIQELAYFYFTHQRSQGGVEEFVILRVLQDYLVRYVIDDQEEARARARDFLDYCAGRAWLLARVGSSQRGERLFGFTHRTFMEYFAGCYFARQYPDLSKFVDRVRSLIDSGSGNEIVPQIAIQRFDEGSAGGLDDCMSVLLFESTTVTNRTRTVYIPFVLRSLRFMSPTPYTLEKIFTAAFRYYSTSRSPEILTLLTSTNRECNSALMRFCERITADVKPNIERSSLSLAIACYMVLAQIDDEKSRNLKIILEKAFLANLEGLSSSGYVDFVSELLGRGLIAPKLFADTCGVSHLLAIEIFTSGRTVRLPGVALLEIQHASECDRSGLSFESDPALEWLFTEPSNLPTLSRANANFFVSYMDNHGSYFDMLPVKLHGRKTISTLRAAALFALLLVIEIDDSEGPQWIDDIVLRISGSSFFAKLQKSREERKSLNDEGLTQLHRLGLGRLWTSYVTDWTTSRFSIIEQ